MAFSGRQRLLFTFLSAILCIILGAKLLYPIFVKAQGTPSTPTPGDSSGGTCDPRKGPELAFFDKGSQEKVYNNVVKRNNFTGNVQAINMVTESAYNPAPGTNVHLRIAGVTHDLQDSVIIAYAASLKAAASQFPDQTLVFFGNEENNLEIEWRSVTVVPAKGNPADLKAAGREYARMYNIFAEAMQGSKFRLAPAPPDMYNGVWTASEWIKGFNEVIKCNNINVLTANVYNLPGTPGIDMYKQWESSICGGAKKVVYFSGFGEDPNNGAGLQAQVDFITKTQLPAGIEAAATLMVDTCNGADSNKTKSDWLYYVCGKVYTASGRKVNANCSTDVNTYYEFSLNRPDADKILNNFYDEYSVSCLPRTQYTVAIKNRDFCDKYPGLGLCPNWGTTGTLKIDAKGKLLGLYRDEASATQRLGFREPLDDRKESLEAFFSAKKTLSQAEAEAELSKTTVEPEKFTAQQGPFYKLADILSQCTAVVDKLKAVDFLCKPENKVNAEDATSPLTEDQKAQCAIDEEIPNTSYTHSSLLSAIGGKSCAEIMDPSKTDPNSTLIRNAILEVRLTMEGAYRPAFVVIATRQKPNGKNTQLGLVGGNEKDTWTVVDYMEVKVPAFASDFVDPSVSAPAESSHTADRYFRDTLKLTADAITSTDFQDMFNKQADAERWAVKNSNAGVTGRVIGDYGTVKCRSEDGKSIEDCNINPTAKALTTFINAYPAAISERTNPNANVKLSEQERQELAGSLGLPCEVDLGTFFPGGDKTKYESATEIGSKLEAKDFYYNSDKPDVAVARKKEATVDVTLHSDSISNNADMSIQEDTRVFFVSPYGQTLRYSRSAFLSLLDTQFLKDAVTTSDNLNSALLADLNRTVTGPEGQRGFLNPESVPPGQKDYVGYKAAVKADTADLETKQPLVWQVAGNVANYPTRLFNMLGSAYGSALNRFTRSCDGNYATEDWFRENCDTSKADKQDDQSGDTLVCAAKYNMTVTLPMGPQNDRLSEAAKITYDTAKKHGFSDQLTYLLWSFIELEGSPYLRKIRAGESTFQCTDSINSCGAVGPLQIIDGICTQDSCGASQKEDLKKLTRPGRPGSELCTFEGAVEIAAQKMEAAIRYAGTLQVSAANLPYFIASRNAGYEVTQTEYCIRAVKDVGGCPTGMNYCQCAVEAPYFHSRFRDHLSVAGRTIGAP